jgi:transglutaminase-like putative cysteine protease
VSQLEQEGHTRTIDAKVRISNYRDNRLPVYYTPTSVSGAGKNWLYDQSRSEVLSNKGVTDFGLTYTVHAAEPDPTRAQLLAAGYLSPNDSIQRKWGARPPVTSKVQAITNSVISGLSKPYERADALNDYFTDGLHGFTYNLQTKSGSSDDALQNFLEQKQGYCEQYASAMAVMLRLAGVPSRVVLGYAQGTYDDKAKRWTISNHDAHAWVEGYFNGIGWVEFDPTPREDGHTSPPAYRDSAPTDPTQPTTVAPSSSTSQPSNQPHTTQSQSPLAAGGGGSSTSAGGSTTPATVGGALALIALVALLLAPAAVRLSHRRRRNALARGPDPGAAAHACWAEILDTMADLHIAPGPAESPRATAARLVGENSLEGPAKSALSIVALAEERARYAEEAGVDADLATALRAARSGLLATASMPRKIWIAIAAPSVMQRVGATLAAGSARTGTAVAGLGRALRLRSANR